MATGALRIESAGIRFGTVLATRDLGRFLLRKSRYAPGLRLPRHEHEGPYFSVVNSGALEERCRTGTSCYRIGSLHYHPGSDPHSVDVGAQGLTCLSIIPRGRLAVVLDARLDSRSVRESVVLAVLGQRCRREFEASDAASDLALEALCLELAATSLRPRLSVREPGIPRWLGEARDYLHAHLDRRVTVVELAQIAGVHPAHLAREFRRKLGGSPGAYLRRLRIERARQALVSTDDPIAVIAFEAGFSSQSHFTCTFREQAGLPPAAYRRACRSGSSR